MISLIMSALDVIKFKKKLLLKYTFILSFIGICILILSLYLSTGIINLRYIQAIILPIISVICYSFFLSIGFLLLILKDKETKKMTNKTLAMLSIFMAILFISTTAFTSYIAIPTFNNEFFYANVNADISYNKILIENDIASTIVFINLTNHLNEAQKDVIIDVNFDIYVAISEDINSNLKTQPFTIEWTDNITRNNVGIRTEYIPSKGTRLDFSIIISWDANKNIPSGMINIQVDGKYICENKEIKLIL